MQPLITILIPIYNRQAYVEECIRSIQAQSWQEWELLLIDDGSTDQTVSICQAFASEDPRIRVICVQHGGVSAARNIGLKNATGKYIFFLDSDDVIHPLLLETLVRSMEQHNVPMSGTLCQSVSEQHWDTVSTAIARDSQLGTTFYRNHRDLLKDVFTSKTPFAMIGGVMIRRDWIGNTQFDRDLYIGEDFYFIYENMIKGADAIFLQEKWYYARLHQSNSSWDLTYSGFMNRLYRRELVWKSEEALGRPEYANIQKRHVLGVFLLCMRQKSLTKEDEQKMRQTMKDYKATLFPSLSLSAKIVYLLLVYMPFTKPVVQYALKLFRRLRNKFGR